MLKLSADVDSLGWRTESLDIILKGDHHICLERSPTFKLAGFRRCRIEKKNSTTDSYVKTNDHGWCPFCMEVQVDKHFFNVDHQRTYVCVKSAEWFQRRKLNFKHCSYSPTCILKLTLVGQDRVLNNILS